MLWCEWPTSWFLLEYSLGMRWKCILEAEVEEGIVGGEEGVRCWGAGGQELGGPSWRTMEEWRSLGAEVLVAPRLASPRLFLGDKVGVEGGSKVCWM